jgi:hypothetical protein
VTNRKPHSPIQQEAPLTHDGSYAVSTPPVTGRRKNNHCNVDGGKLSSNGGVLVLREIELKLGFAVVLSRHIPDDRDQLRPNTGKIRT